MNSAETALKATLLTFIISALGFLPPVLHFITGPLGPGIGGYIGGNRYRVNALQAAIVGLVVGVVDGLLGPWIILSLNHLHFSGGITYLIYGFAMLYSGVLSGAAAWLGGLTAPGNSAA